MKQNGHHIRQPCSLPMASDTQWHIEDILAGGVIIIIKIDNKLCILLHPFTFALYISRSTLQWFYKRAHFLLRPYVIGRTICYLWAVGCSWKYLCVCKNGAENKCVCLLFEGYKLVWNVSYGRFGKWSPLLRLFKW